MWVPMNPLQDWKAKLESAYSLMVQNYKNTVWYAGALSNARSIQILIQALLECGVYSR